ncbi:MAG: HypC/HybG/HupF family hydrogenase formation chaperone [Acidobacteria bacterium]|jgi:hydrogenase expression/formation protein HypC|nr:MAG: HypC/HybG/HupF family hydrogenase formation chaperone [Acidobacteriota bacterium]
MCLAVPGQLQTKTTVGGLAVGRVSFGGISREVCLDFVPEVKVGDYVLVHVGFAIARLDAAEAARAYETLEQMGLMAEELEIQEETEPTPQVRPE